ncbi:MAG: hypothetical protein ACPG46_10545 [Thalassotalea sp.]
MMINTNYTQAITQAKSNNASVVHFDRASPQAKTKDVEQDTVTLSAKAQAMIDGKQVNEVAPIYVKPETARELLAQNQPPENNTKETERKTRFSDIMQNILDKRTGVDRKKLEAIDALMKEIGENENMSPEEKQKALEELAKIREKIVEESLQLQKNVKENTNSASKLTASE